MRNNETRLMVARVAPQILRPSGAPSIVARKFTELWKPERRTRIAGGHPRRNAAVRIDNEKGLSWKKSDERRERPFLARVGASQEDELTTGAPTAEKLAQQFTEINAALLDAAETCPPEKWRQPIAGEPRPVGVIAHHVSEVEGFFAGVLSGAIPDVAVTMTDIDANNGRHAAEHANIGQAETVAALRKNGEALAQVIASLGAEDLQTPAFAVDGEQLTKEQIIQFGVINHFQEHLASIRAAVRE